MCGLAPSRILGAIRYVAGGWETATIRCLPTGTFQVRDGHLAARAGARDGVVADRGRPARLRPVRDRGAARRHEHLAARPRHVRQPQPPGRRRRALSARARRSSRRRGSSWRTSSRSPPTTSTTTAGTFSVKGSPDKSMTIKEAAWAAFAAHNLPGRDGAGPGGDGDVRPAELLLAGRRARRGRRGRHGDRRRAARPLRRGRRRRHGRQPADRRRAGARRHHAGDRARPSTRRPSTTRTATC